MAEEAERKRVEAQDAALKEILNSAAAEKKKIEEEALKVAKEKAERAAKEAAEKLAREQRQQQQQQQRQQQQQQQLAKSSIADSTAEATKATQPRQGSTIVSAAASDATSPSKDAKEKDQSRKTAETSLGSKDPSTASGQHGEVVKQSSTQSGLAEDPLEPFKARLLPYKKSIESSTEYIRSSIPDSLRQLSESVKRKDYRDTIAQLSEHLNNFTGYNAINDLKHKVIAHGESLDDARIKLAQAKYAYEDAISTRSDTQKAINDLLQRKHLWSPDDVIRFTDLYRSEHANEQAEQKTKIEYKQAESNVEEKSRRLTRVIMERYHEEQVWSDKIRAASTYGTWGLVGVNVMAFLIVQAFVEPRRRRKQVERYEELVRDLTERGILPEKALSIETTAGSNGGITGVAQGPNTVDQVSDNTLISTAESTPVAIGGALSGGEDVLQRLIKSAERQEERLDRMEDLLLKQASGEQDKRLPKLILEEMHGSVENGELVLAEDGSIVLLSEGDDGETIDLGEAWREELGKRSKVNTEGMQSRLSLILQDGDAEVPARRRDFLVSGLGGALVGGLIAVAVMMNR
ncbi:sensitivity to high expression protein she9 [Gamsiella multidivaricata]|nr:sensitivity to high expression protein she9 [Gamsiella multidivaricata]